MIVNRLPAFALAVIPVSLVVGCSQVGEVPKPDQVVVVKTGNAGPALAPVASVISEAVNATECTQYTLNPSKQGGDYSEIHLRVPGARATSAAAVIKALRGIVVVTVEPLNSFNTAPTAAGVILGPSVC